jgi:hypothetical protein
LEQALLPHLERRVAEPPAAALEAVVAGGASPVRERLFNVGYVKRWEPAAVTVERFCRAMG